MDPAGDVEWNFKKFLVGKDGTVIARFKSGVTPEDLKSAIEAARQLEPTPQAEPQGCGTSPSPRVSPIKPRAADQSPAVKCFMAASIQLLKVVSRQKPIPSSNCRRGATGARPTSPGGQPQNIHQQVLIAQMQSQLPAARLRVLHPRQQASALQFQLQAWFQFQAWVPLRNPLPQPASPPRSRPAPAPQQ